MRRPVTLCTLQWGDLSLSEVCRRAKLFGYDGLELGIPSHVDTHRKDASYYAEILELLKRHDLKLYALANHLVSQAVCDRIDDRHRGLLPDWIWGDGAAEGIRVRAAESVIETAEAAKRLGASVVTGFTGSSIWHLLYSFPPVSDAMITSGYADFSRRWLPILDEYARLGIRYALEVHPSEIAFDTYSASRALSAVNNHPAFGFNFDPSHLGYQGVDYVDFIYHFSDRIFHVHMKDVYWRDTPCRVGIFGGHVPFGDPLRYWNFRSIGRGSIRFEEIIRALNSINYVGPLSVEWEDSAMDRDQGATESCRLVKSYDFEPSSIAFDAHFGK